MKRDIILENRMKDIIDRNYLEEQEDNLIVNTENVKDTITDINELYSKEPDIYIDPIPTFDTAIPDISDIDRDKFVDVETLYESDYLKLDPLSYFWYRYLPKYQVLKSTTNNKSLLYSFIRILNQKDQLSTSGTIAKKEDSNTNVGKAPRYTLLKLKDEYIDYLIELNNTAEGKLILNKLMKNLNIELPVNEKPDLLEIYKIHNPDYYYNIMDNNGLYKFISMDTYIPNLIDVYLLTKLLKMNVIVIYKRKEGEYYFRIFPFGEDEDEYILLYRHPYENMTIYNLIQYQGNVIYNKNDFPNKFKELVFKKPEENIDVTAQIPLEGVESAIEIKITKKPKTTTKTNMKKKTTTKKIIVKKNTKGKTSKVKTKSKTVKIKKK